MLFRIELSLSYFLSRCFDSKSGTGGGLGARSQSINNVLRLCSADQAAFAEHSLPLAVLLAEDMASIRASLGRQPGSCDLEAFLDSLVCLLLWHRSTMLLLEVYVQICPNKGDGGVSRASPEAVKSVPIPSHLTGKRQEYRHHLIVNSSDRLQRFRFTGKGLRQMAEDSCPSGQDSILL